MPSKENLNQFFPLFSIPKGKFPKLKKKCTLKIKIKSSLLSNFLVSCEKNDMIQMHFQEIAK